MKLSAIVTVLMALGAIGEVTAKWAKFCNDDNCKVGCGISVNIDNDGCLTQKNRRSVWIPTHTMEIYEKRCLVMTQRDGGCSCQSSSMGFDTSKYEGKCYRLDPKYKSYRFIKQGCGKNNCRPVGFAKGRALTSRADEGEDEEEDEGAFYLE